MFLFVFCYTPTFCRDGLELGQKQMCRNTAAIMAAAEENVTFLRSVDSLLYHVHVRLGYGCVNLCVWLFKLRLSSAFLSFHFILEKGWGKGKAHEELKKGSVFLYL